MKTQLLLLYDCSTALVTGIERDGPFLCTPKLPEKVYLKKPPSIVPGTGKVPLDRKTVQEINRTMALSCEYDEIMTDESGVRHALTQVAVAIQLVKPSRLFLELWLQLDKQGETDLVSPSIRDLEILIGPDEYLRYQQLNTIEEADVQEALGLLPNLARALDRSPGSWEHTVLSIHRAVIFFCQGYTVNSDPTQFLWAAGLDCLYASKLDKRKQSSKEMSERIGKLLQTGPYDTVGLPRNQQPRKKLPAATVALDIFQLRNAFAHGKPIPDPTWLGSRNAEKEESYAYQLVEQTEILLRQSLIRILKDPDLFETFADPGKLDTYFS